jgi:catechol 2,3-dioxygenase-like lactoylglutathione lyase family enzyme
MPQRIANVMLVVDEYDRAIAFFKDALGFVVHEDEPRGGGKRWVRVGPAGSEGAGIVLGKAGNPGQQASIGNQTGGRVFLFLETDDFWRDYRRLESHGVRFTEAPREEPYGTVVVFLDLYGNKWDLIGRRATSAAGSP